MTKSEIVLHILFFPGSLGGSTALHRAGVSVVLGKREREGRFERVVIELYVGFFAPCTQGLLGFFVLELFPPPCFLNHAKWNETFLADMQILMQSSNTYGARTSAFVFDLCF